MIEFSENILSRHYVCERKTKTDANKLLIKIEVLKQLQCTGIFGFFFLLHVNLEIGKSKIKLINKIVFNTVY